MKKIVLDENTRLGYSSVTGYFYRKEDQESDSGFSIKELVEGRCVKFIGLQVQVVKITYVMFEDYEIYLKSCKDDKELEKSISLSNINKLWKTGEVVFYDGKDPVDILAEKVRLLFLEIKVTSEIIENVSGEKKSIFWKKSRKKITEVARLISRI